MRSERASTTPSVRDELDAAVRALRSSRFLIGSEATVQTEAEKALVASGLPFKRELRLDPKNRIDFLVGRIGVEVKVKGSRRAILRQVERYCGFDEVKAIILLTGVAMGLPATINDKPVEIVSLGEAWL